MFKFVKSKDTPALAILADQYDRLTHAMERTRLAMSAEPQAASELDNAWQTNKAREIKDAAIADKTAQHASAILDAVVAIDDLSGAVVAMQSTLNDPEFKIVDCPYGVTSVRGHRLVHYNNYVACAALFRSALVVLAEVSRLIADLGASEYEELITSVRKWKIWVGTLPTIADLHYDYSHLGDEGRSLLLQCIAAVVGWVGCGGRYPTINGAPFFRVDVSSYTSVVIDPVVACLQAKGWTVQLSEVCLYEEGTTSFRLAPPKRALHLEPPREAVPPISTKESAFGGEKKHKPVDWKRFINRI